MNWTGESFLPTAIFCPNSRIGYVRKTREDFEPLEKPVRSFTSGYLESLLFLLSFFCLILSSYAFAKLMIWRGVGRKADKSSVLQTPPLPRRSRG